MLSDSFRKPDGLLNSRTSCKRNNRLMSFPTECSSNWRLRMKIGKWTDQFFVKKINKKDTISPYLGKKRKALYYVNIRCAGKKALASLWYPNVSNRMVDSEKPLHEDSISSSMGKCTMGKNTEGMESHSVMYHRTSFVDNILSPSEKRFLKLVEQGDIDGLKSLLKIKRQLNFDCCDYRGRRALDIAIKKRNIAMYEFLQQELEISNLHYYCAMLTAVLENDVYIFRNVTQQKGTLKLQKMFLERGYFVKKPHSPHCACDTCCANRKKAGETLTESMSRINTYRTLASPTYLILTTCDPILAAFQLSYELEQLSCELPEHQ
ncbi:transient-receptor-potential-like protein, partial [Trichonephila clavata]